MLALTEFGGYSMAVPGHCASEKLFGYKMYHTAGDLMEAYLRLYREEILPHMEERGLSAAVYTQLSDVEDEVNGLLTFDHRPKFDCDVIRAINEGCWQPGQRTEED